MKALLKYARTIRTLICLPLAAFSGACDSPHSQDAAKIEKSEALPAVTQTAELIAATRAHRLSGVATILSSDPLLQINADLNAARISADFSTATAERYKATNSLSRQIIETAERQAGIDMTQQKLLENRLKHSWGEAAPFLDSAKRQKLIAELSAGSEALVRLDFPDLTDSAPRNVRVAPLSGGKDTPVKILWAAPSGNLSMPGVSFFGLIDAGPGLRPGDRAHVSADSQAVQTGVIVPSAAVVLFQGQSWCYIETGPGKFERRQITLDTPIDDGYLVTSGLTAGQRVVVRGASVLLSREAGPGEDDDDDNDGGDAPKAKPQTAPVQPSAHSPHKSGSKDKDDDDDKPAAKPAADKPVATNPAPGPAATVAEKHGAPAAVDKD